VSRSFVSFRLRAENLALSASADSGQLQFQDSSRKMQEALQHTIAGLKTALQDEKNSLDRTMSEFRMKVTIAVSTSVVLHGSFLTPLL